MHDDKNVLKVKFKYLVDWKNFDVHDEAEDPGQGKIKVNINIDKDKHW